MLCPLSRCSRLLDQAIVRLQACSKLIQLQRFRAAGNTVDSSNWRMEVKRKTPCDQRIRQFGSLRYILQVK